MAEVKPEIIDKAVEVGLNRERVRLGLNPISLDDLSTEGTMLWRDEYRAALTAVADDMRRDEHHTMDELYEFRMLYNALAANLMPSRAVKSWRHSDGELCFGGGWFVVFLDLPTGQVSNHYKAEHWDLFRIPEQETAPEYDGHTAADTAQRMREAVPLLADNLRAEGAVQALAPLWTYAQQIAAHFGDDWPHHGGCMGDATDSGCPLCRLLAATAPRADRIEARDE